MSKKISWFYLVGLLQTDGSFSLEFKEDKSMTIRCRLLPVLSFSQKRLFLLENFKEFLKENKIPSKIDGLKPNLSKRAPRLRITGVNNVKSFLLQAESYCENQLTGVKRFDYQLMKAVFSIIEKNEHNTSEGRKKIIDLKFSFHTPPLPYPLALQDNLISCGFEKPEIKAIPSANRLGRTEWENRHGFDTSSTQECASMLLHDVIQDFYQSCEKAIEGFVNNSPSILHPEFISGVVDGNGYISDSKSKFVFTITMPTGSESSLLSFAHYFQDRKPNFYLSQGSAFYKATKKELLFNIQNHAKKAPFFLKIVP